MDHDTRDLDGVIDEVAQAMTGAELRRDLRPAIAARIAGRPWWTLDWRLGAAAAALASVVVVVVVMRPGGEPKMAPSAPVATVEPAPRVEPGPTTRPPRADLTAPLPLAEVRAVSRAPGASVGRQRIAATRATTEVVEITPLAIAPLDTDDASDPPMVEIAPIDIAPVRVSQLESIAE